MLNDRVADQGLADAAAPPGPRIQATAKARGAPDTVITKALILDR